MRVVIFVTVLLFSGVAVSAQIMTGAEQMNQYLPLLKGKSVAVFANATSVVGHSHLVDTLLRSGVHIVRIFSPEHGFRGDADAGAVVGNQQDPATGIPIVSLYGKKVRPDAADLSDVDVLLYDIQDVGVRFYTYISSLQMYMESAIAHHLPLLILDRPDPNGFYVDGPVLDTAFRSFVGEQPVPIVYGMTIGEYAGMLLGEGWVKANVGPNGQTASGGLADPGFRLVVIPCVNYTHRSRYVLPVKPSPNLPNMRAVYLYPSLCLLEGTTVSLGRGTSKPFQQIGHPDFPDNLYQFTPESLPGARNPPQLGRKCFGYDLSDTSKAPDQQFDLKWLILAYLSIPNKADFFSGTGSGFDRLAGSAELRKQIIARRSEEEIRSSWEPALSRFKEIRKKYLLYAD